MTNYSAILVDDEQPAHYAMQALLRKYPKIKLIGQAYNGLDAIEYINKLKPDVVFLDIQMPGLNGFEIAKKLIYQPCIVFCTAYDQYALEAFNHNSIDYLLKPIDDKRFAACIEKIERFSARPSQYDAAKLIELSNLLQKSKKATAIPIHINSRIIFVKCEDISYCFSKDGYVSIFNYDGKENICDLTLKQLEELLPDYFLRVQKSYIVNKSRIKEIQRYFNNRLKLIMDDRDQTKITTGTSYIEDIRRELLL